jgi:hypothetical protein
MSRATLRPEIGAVIEECLEEVDRTFRMSRAGLERELVRKLASLHEKSAAMGAPRGQAEP